MIVPVNPVLFGKDLMKRSLALQANGVAIARSDVIAAKSNWLPDVSTAFRQVVEAS